MFRWNERKGSELGWLVDWRWSQWERSYGRLKVSLSEWLDLFVVTKPYQNEWKWWDLNELKWIEVKWVIWWNWLRTTLWEWSYGRLRVSLWKWLDLFVVTKSFQNDQNRWEMSELSEMKWNDGFDGFDLEQPYEKVPMVSRRWTLSKWLDVSENECPYQNEWNRWEMNELKWIEWIEVKWRIWRIWLCEPYGNGPMVSRRWTLWKWLEMSDLIKPYQNDQNRWEMNE